MTTRSAAEQADHLSRRRARMLPFLAVIYLSQQVSFFADAGSGDRPVDHVKVGAWVVLSLVLLAALTTKGFWLRRREVREMIDDETTKAHRGEALVQRLHDGRPLAVRLLVRQQGEDPLDVQ